MAGAEAETTMARFKQPIGDGRRSGMDVGPSVRSEVATRALNRVLERGRPNSVRIA